MANSQMNGVLRHLRRVAVPQESSALTDGQLLERFLATREEAAFEAILRRHGPMVLGVCRRVLFGVQDAEDAFQATFLVLVHKAASVVTREAVGSWLHGVAYRTARKARAAAARRRAREKQMARPEALQEPDAVWRELRPLIDQELSRLPDKYRTPILLCDLQGQTRKQAARQLGCPEGTISGRLARARVMLAKRLARHGLALSAGALAAVLSQGAASACVRAPLVVSTIRAATLVAAGHAAAGAVSAPVVALTEGVLRTMGISKLKLVLVALLAVSMLGTGWGVYCSGAADTPQAKQIRPPAPAIGGGGGGFGAAGAPRPAGGVVGPAGAGAGGIAVVMEDEKINLPSGPAPVQVLASIDKDGKLLIKKAMATLRPLPGGIPAPPAFVPRPGLGGAPGAPGGGGFVVPPGAGGGGAPGAPGAGGPGAPPGGGPGAGAPAGGAPGGIGVGRPGVVAPGGGGAGGGPFGGRPGAGLGGAAPAIAPGQAGQFVVKLHAQAYDLDSVEVLDSKGKKIDSKELMRLLKEETVALASWQQPLDPLHLRVVKDGTLIFVLPAPALMPPGAPGIPRFAPGAAPGGLGIEAPAPPGLPAPAQPGVPPPNEP
jgi:RNA polymerase sigma factor (sigma-70 family)